jgi:hypothetical protein
MGENGFRYLCGRATWRMAGSGGLEEKRQGMDKTGERVIGTIS